MRSGERKKGQYRLQGWTSDANQLQLHVMFIPIINTEHLEIGKTQTYPLTVSRD